MKTLPALLAFWLLVPAVTLSACSSATTGSSATPSAGSSPQGAAPGQPDGQDGRGGDRQPGVSGLIADITDQTMQVQGSDGQTAVTWTDATTFTQRVTGTAADVTVGVCVSGFGSQDGAVSQLSVSQPTDDQCQMGGGGMGAGGSRPTGVPSGMPSGAPGDGQRPPTDAPSGAPGAVPSGMPSGGPGGGSMVSGLVTGVDGTTVTVKDADGEESTFTLEADATVSTSVAATAAAAVVGGCAAAQGATDETGALTATGITLSEATDGECGGGFR